MIEQRLVKSISTENITAKKGLLRRVGEKLGLVQKEVQSCKGKSLSQMADMTSIKESIQRYKDCIEQTKKVLEFSEKDLKKYSEFRDNDQNRLGIVNSKLHNIRINNGYNDFNAVAGDCYARGGETYEQFAARRTKLQEEKQDLEQRLSLWKEEIPHCVKRIRECKDKLADYETKIKELQYKLTNS